MMVSLKYVVSPIRFIYTHIVLLITSVLNQRNIFTLIWNFAINFSPVFIWLLIFKNAGLIPHSYRPKINVKLLPHLEDFIYNMSSIHSWICMLIISFLSFSIYQMSYNFFKKPIQDVENKTFVVDEMESDHDIYELNYTISNTDDSSSDSSTSNSTPTPPFLKQSITNNSNNNNDTHTQHTTRIKYSRMAPPILLLASWFMLNFLHYISPYQSTALDILAWFSYVLGHFCAPLFTAIWLYVFHCPGLLKWFSITLGCQNISGVLTHLIFPNASPWFINLYGEDHEANYDMLGYAAGLVRVDVALGTHLNSNGFHKSPIVFGAFPSLHSLMAVLVFFHLTYYGDWNILKFIGGLFVMIQWWATIYLDHHWRIDLLGGLCYALFYFTLFQNKRIALEKRFQNAKSVGNFHHGSTVGMRFFKNTRFQSFFEPNYS